MYLPGIEPGPVRFTSEQCATELLTFPLDFDFKTVQITIQWKYVSVFFIHDFEENSKKLCLFEFYCYSLVDYNFHW